MSSTIAIATSAATNTRRSRPPSRPAPARAALLERALQVDGRGLERGGEAEDAAGRRSATANVASRMRGSRLDVGQARESTRARARRAAAGPTRRARRRPRRRAPARTSDSVRSWRIVRPRLAPRAARRATSRWRVEERARSMFATLAQAMSRTRPTAREQHEQRRAARRRRPSLERSDRHVPVRAGELALERSP